MTALTKAPSGNKASMPGDQAKAFCAHSHFVWRFISASLLFIFFSLLVMYAPLNITIVLIGGLWLMLAVELWNFSKKAPRLTRFLIRLTGVLLLIYSFLNVMGLAYTYGCFQVRFLSFLLPTIWLTDICAFLGGRIFKGPRFAPKISPNKTWSGVVCGYIAGTLWAICSLVFLDALTKAGLLLSFTLPLGVIYGDLAVSWAKRLSHTKDTGKLIPGHGGLWDRFDSTVFVLAFLFVTHFLFERPLTSFYALIR